MKEKEEKTTKSFIYVEELSNQINVKKVKHTCSCCCCCRCSGRGGWTKRSCLTRRSRWTWCRFRTWTRSGCRRARSCFWTSTSSSRPMTQLKQFLINFHA